MNIALVFAGGTGQRMNTKSMPKQFLELHGKPIIIYTLEQFEMHPDVDGIVIACIESHIAYMQKLLENFNIKKVVGIVPGGHNGQESIFHGLCYIEEHFPDDSVVLIHDGVRPLIDAGTISKCIESTLKHGNGITVTAAVETIVADSSDGKLGTIMDRSRCKLARAPQAFILKDIIASHKKAIKEGKTDFIDSASLMRNYGFDLCEVEGLPENIKITTPVDFYIFRAVVDAKESFQILGL